MSLLALGRQLTSSEALVRHKSKCARTIERIAPRARYSCRVRIYARCLCVEHGCSAFNPSSAMPVASQDSASPRTRPYRGLAILALAELRLFVVIAASAALNLVQNLGQSGASIWTCSPDRSCERRRRVLAEPE